LHNACYAFAAALRGALRGWFRAWPAIDGLSLRELRIARKTPLPINNPSPAAALDFARALIDTSQLPLLLLNGEARVVCASNSFHGVFDIAADTVEGRTLAEIGGGGWDILQLNLLVDNAIGDGPRMPDYETDLVRPNLRTRRLLVNVRNIIPGSSPDTRVVIAITDVTHVRSAERLNVALLLEKDTLLRERADLMDEMQHRIANSLQIIASVLLLKARGVKSDETRQHLQDAHNRVMSLAAVQQHLQSTVGSVEVGPYLTKLCGSLAASMIREARPLTLKVLADETTVTSHEAVSLGLVVTELVINALKHAFPSKETGRIDVRYQVKDKSWTLSVTDNGIGMPAHTAASKAGLGTSIVQGLARQLGATVAVTDAKPGVAVTLHGVNDVAAEAAPMLSIV
jgi:two-component sensor histidine kinase